MAMVKKNEETDMVIKPESVAPTVDTTEWPLLLKNWEKRTSQAQTSSYMSYSCYVHHRLESVNMWK